MTVRNLNPILLEIVQLRKVLLIYKHVKKERKRKRKRNMNELKTNMNELKHKQTLTRINIQTNK